MEDNDVNRFESGKISNFLSDVNNNPLAVKAITIDKIYFQALGAANDEDKVIHFWRYLESYFDYIGYKASDIMEKVSTVLALGSNISYIYFVHNLAWYILDGDGVHFDHKYFSISKEELNEHRANKSIHEIKFYRLREIINHPYITNQLDWFITSSDVDKIREAKAFWADILFETYEQRNLLEHSGIFNRQAVKKLAPILARLAFKFRYIISKDIKSGKYQDFQRLITELLKLESFIDEISLEK